jgi:5-methylcytosine-specific restriction endonuclease McrA
MVFATTMAATRRTGAVTGFTRLEIAAQQNWTCSSCLELLPAAFEIDHTVPLCNGGDDSVANATAMCANCHATKTRREHDARLATAQSKQHMYDAREDTHKNGCATCTLCKKTRPNGSPHPVCWAIEGKSTVGIAASLAKFKWL